MSNAGDSLYYIGGMWLVFELTGSALYTGIAGFLLRAPAAISFLIGPLVDQWGLKRILIGTQLTNGILVLVIPVAHWFDSLSVWLLLVVLPVVTFLNQFVYPAQDAALPLLVGKENLAKANSLLAASSQGTNSVFNAASGIFIGMFGAIGLFVIDSSTFWIALLMFVGLSVPSPESESPGDDHGESERKITGYFEELSEGFDYVRGSLLINLMLGVFIANLAGGAMFGVMPAFAETVGGADTFGLLMAGYAGGSLAGTILSSYFDDYPLGWIAIAANVLSGVLLAVALVVPWVSVTVLFFFLSFIPMGIFNILFFTMIQSAVETEILGRVSSLVRSAAVLSLPLGSVLGGVAASVGGSLPVMFSWPVGALIFALYVVVRPRLRSLSTPTEIDTAELGLGDPTTSVD